MTQIVNKVFPHDWTINRSGELGATFSDGHFEKFIPQTSLGHLREGLVRKMIAYKNK